MKKKSVLKVLLMVFLSTAALSSCEKDIDIKDVHEQETVLETRSSTTPPPGEEEDVDIVSKPKGGG